MSDTAVLECTCEHAFQDAHYGKGRRLHNAGGKQPGSVTKKPPSWHCTVCGKEKPRTE